MTLDLMGKAAKSAAHKLSVATTEQKNKALLAIANALRDNTDKIITANEKDIANARDNGISDTMVDRLRLTKDRIFDIAKSVEQVVNLADPVGRVIDGYTRPNGLKISKITVPIGAIGIIFESRPNVTVDAAVLCLKSGNATILRGGKEAINSNIALADIMRDAIKSAGLDENCVQLISDTSRQTATELMRLNKYLDLLIPRGGAGLIKAVVENSTVPVIETGTGNCHIYIDESADLQMAAQIVNNAKTQRPSVCNACESLLVHTAVADAVLPKINDLFKEHNVEIRGCARTCEILENAVPATDEDYATEFLDYTISVRVVDNIDEAIDHIMTYTSGHSECIVTNNHSNAEKFTNEIDAAAVYVNASTRFTDGGEFGLGAEIGISTQKLHARGPMGLNELTSFKFIVQGNGQIR